MNFKVGQKVVCIDRFGYMCNKGESISSVPKKDSIYEVDGYSSKAFVYLAEFKQTNMLGTRCAWDVRAFVPLQDIKEAERAVNELVKELLEPIKL